MLCIIAPHQLIDVREWGCDFLACSAYKFHGPHVGVLYGKREQLEALDVPKLQPAPETVPEKAGNGDAEPRGNRRARPRRSIISPHWRGQPPVLHPARGANDCAPCSRHFTSAG